MAESDLIETITAPLSGVVEQVLVNPGQRVDSDELIAVLESMKVHVRVEAKTAGVVVDVNLVKGDAVERRSVIATLKSDSFSTVKPSNEPILSAHKPEPSLTDRQHPTTDAWKKRQALSLDENRQEAVAKRHSKGYSTARENLARLCDPSLFIEYGQLAVAAQRQRQDYDSLKSSTAADGVITGIADVSNTQTALIINDYSVLAGTQGFFHHQKIDRMLAVAAEKQLPVIMFTEGGGGRPGDTDVTTVNSGLQCTSFSTWAGLSGIVPRIAVANGYNFAGNAALFGAADITVATETSWIGMAGPAMISGGGLGNFKPTEIGPIDTQSTNGVVDIVVKDENEACAVAKHLVRLLASTPSQDFKTPDQAKLHNLMPENRHQTYPVRTVLETVADQGTLIELQSGFGGSVVTAFLQVEEKTVGVLANDSCVLGGAIDVDAGQKTARFMQLCNELALPIVSFCDTPGFMVGPQHEEYGAVRKLAELFKIGAQITVPFYAVVLRKCYGLGAQAMLGGNTQRPIYTMSWPSGEFGAMGLEGAVTLGFKKELDAQPDEESRSKLFDDLLAQQYAKGQATEVASVLELDAVINPIQTRATLAQLLS